MSQPAGRRLRDADGLSLLDHDVLQLPDVPPVKRAEMCFGPTQSCLLLGEALADLLEAEADIAQGHDAVQPPQLMDAVEAVSAVGVDPVGDEKTKLVVVAQHAR
jgi:hypothetical protein